jgi:hypothetical protein
MDIEKLQRLILIDKEYVKGNIKKIISELENLDITTYSNIDDKEYESFIAKTYERFELIKHLLQTKKIESNKKDFIELGKYVQQLGTQIEKYGVDYKDEIEQLETEKKDDTSKSNVHKQILNDIKKDLDETIDDFLNEILEDM